MSEGNGEPIFSELVKQDPDFADLVVEFVDGLSERLAEMQQTLDEGDYEALRRMAHQLKGSAGGYGYPGLTDLASVLEDRAARSAGQDCKASVEAVTEMVGRVMVKP